MWNELPLNNKEEYKNQILAFASLTETFAQKVDEGEMPAPIINSKYQETVFQKAFNAVIEDIGNSSYDASLIVHGVTEEKYLIGIKTFGVKANLQKIAQFKKQQQDEWSDKIAQLKHNATGLTTKEDVDNVNDSLYRELAVRISELRNARIESSIQQLKGFSVNVADLDINEHIHSVYHLLMPSEKNADPKIYVKEISYNKIDIANITIIGCTQPNRPENFEFEDGIHRYKYTPADSQLYMDFQNADTMEVWDVIYVEDAYQVFADLGRKIYGNNTATITEEYIWPIEVHPFSGFNNFYGVGSKLSSDKRIQIVDNLRDKYDGIMLDDDYDSLISELREFFVRAQNHDERMYKVQLRDEIMRLVKTTDNADFIKDVAKLLYRPVTEMYIPIPNSKKFHQLHPNFFGIDKHFTLIFEPSKSVMPAYITQDNGKAIESEQKQSYLGVWILRGIFQLQEYEPLTQQRLNELEINSMKLYKTSESDDVHLEFIYTNPDEMPDPCENRICHID